MRKCMDCGTGLVPGRQWARLTLAERARLRAEGMNRASGARCEPCYCAHRRGVLRDANGRQTVPAVAVLEDWQMLADRDRSRAANIRLLAPRMGMTEAALSKALDRAKARGELGSAA